VTVKQISFGKRFTAGEQYKNIKMTIEETEKEIVEEFEIFGEDWEGKYEHLIELGKSLPVIEDKFKTDDRLIKGCQSKVWLHSELKDGKIYFTADSDAIITKGMVALMVRVLSGHTPKEIQEANLDFINKIGLKEHLSPTRANGLVNMIKQMKLDALALGAKNSI
jgi:cysteine desulfuration protein SufE